ncbi:MAG: fimbrial biogenesis chaperone [Azovibrio sp.]
MTSKPFSNAKKMITARATLLLAAVMAAVLAVPASASVIVQTTRVIYPGNAKQVSVQLTNQDAYPNVMQVWADINNPQSNPETADAPFVITPPLFRIEPKAGQAVRLMFTGADLPQDRESIFFLNVLQIPPSKAEFREENQVMLMLRNRLKIFYRPTGVAGNSADVPTKLRFSLRQEGQDWLVDAENPTGFYATLTHGVVQVEKQQHPFQPEMLAPFSKATWRISKAGPLPRIPVQVEFILIDDYGAQITGSYGVKP